MNRTIVSFLCSLLCFTSLLNSAQKQLSPDAPAFRAQAPTFLALNYGIEVDTNRISLGFNGYSIEQILSTPGAKMLLAATPYQNPTGKTDTIFTLPSSTAPFTFPVGTPLIYDITRTPQGNLNPILLTPAIKDFLHSKCWLTDPQSIINFAQTLENPLPADYPLVNEWNKFITPPKPQLPIKTTPPALEQKKEDPSLVTTLKKQVEKMAQQMDEMKALLSQKEKGESANPVSEEKSKNQKKEPATEKKSTKKKQKKNSTKPAITIQQPSKEELQRRKIAETELKLKQEEEAKKKALELKKQEEAKKIAKKEEKKARQKAAKEEKARQTEQAEKDKEARFNQQQQELAAKQVTRPSSKKIVAEIDYAKQLAKKEEVEKSPAKQTTKKKKKKKKKVVSAQGPAQADDSYEFLELAKKEKEEEEARIENARLEKLTPSYNLIGTSLQVANKQFEIRNFKVAVKWYIKATNQIQLFHKNFPDEEMISYNGTTKTYKELIKNILSSINQCYKADKTSIADGEYANFGYKVKDLLTIKEIHDFLSKYKNMGKLMNKQTQKRKKEEAAKIQHAIKVLKGEKLEPPAEESENGLRNYKLGAYLFSRKNYEEGLKFFESAYQEGYSSAILNIIETARLLAEQNETIGKSKKDEELISTSLQQKQKALDLSLKCWGKRKMLGSEMQAKIPAQIGLCLWSLNTPADINTKKYSEILQFFQKGQELDDSISYFYEALMIQQMVHPDYPEELFCKKEIHYDCTKETCGLKQIIFLFHNKKEVLFPDELSPEALCGLGIMYDEGKVVECNEAKAYEFFNLALSKESKKAQGYIGQYMIEGKNGCPQDIKEGLRLVELSADEGFPESQKYFYKTLLNNSLITDKFFFSHIQKVAHYYTINKEDLSEKEKTRTIEKFYEKLQKSETIMEKYQEEFPEILYSEEMNGLNVLVKEITESKSLLVQKYPDREEKFINILDLSETITRSYINRFIKIGRYDQAFILIQNFYKEAFENEIDQLINLKNEFKGQINEADIQKVLNFASKASTQPLEPEEIQFICKNRHLIQTILNAGSKEYQMNKDTVNIIHGFSQIIPYAHAHEQVELVSRIKTDLKDITSLFIKSMDHAPDEDTEACDLLILLCSKFKEEQEYKQAILEAISKLLPLSLEEADDHYFKSIEEYLKK